jgi:hypothetical protein
MSRLTSVASRPPPVNPRRPTAGPQKMARPLRQRHPQTSLTDGLTCTGAINPAPVIPDGNRTPEDRR